MQHLKAKKHKPKFEFRTLIMIFTTFPFSAICVHFAFRVHHDREEGRLLSRQFVFRTRGQELGRRRGAVVGHQTWAFVTMPQFQLRN